jgi:hypothetical protein
VFDWGSHRGLDLRVSTLHFLGSVISATQFQDMVCMSKEAKLHGLPFKRLRHVYRHDQGKIPPIDK